MVKTVANKKVNENIEMYTEKWMTAGEVADGYTAAYDNEEQKGGVVYGDTFYPTLPLNMTRIRELSYALQGTSWSTIGGVVEVDAQVVKDLTGFDSKNQAFADSFEGTVMVSVVRTVPSYGVHVRVRQL